MIDKWLSLQASIPEPATLARVKALTSHPAFSMSNPNRVRALFGAFAMSNQTQLNRPDGAGYDLLADTVLALDPKNPQVAARLLTALKSWRVLEPGTARDTRKRRCARSPRSRRCRATSATSSRARLLKTDRFPRTWRHLPRRRPAQRFAESVLSLRRLAKKPWVLKNSLMTLDKFSHLGLQCKVIRGDAAHPSDRSLVWMIRTGATHGARRGGERVCQ